MKRISFSLIVALVLLAITQVAGPTAHAAMYISLTYHNHDVLYTKLNNTTNLGVYDGVKPYTVTASNGNIKVTPVPGTTHMFTVTAVSPGKSVVTVRDAKGAVVTKEFTIASDLEYTLSTSTYTVGEKFTVTLRGGIPPYTVSPATANTATVKALSATVFEITPQDKHVSFQLRDSKRGNTMFHITAQTKTDFVAPLKAMLSMNPIDAGTSTSLTVSGGTQPYTVSSANANVTVAPFSTQSDKAIYSVKGVTGGSSVISVKDSKGQQTTVALTVKSNAPLLYSIISASTVPVNQSVELEPKGGVAPYRVSAPAGSVTITPLANNKFRITGAQAGKIRLTIIDAAGTQAGADLEVIGSLMQVSHPKEFFTPGVTGTFTVKNGKAPYTVISSAPSIASVTNVSPGLYRIQALAPGNADISVTDSAGYRVRLNITVFDTVKMTFTAFPEGTLRVIDVGQSTPLVVSGGTAPYTVTADRPSAVTIQQQGVGRYIVTGREAGVIGITVRDHKGNTRSLSLTVRALPTLTVSGPSAMTVGQTATLTLIGGAAPFTVTQSGGQVSLTRQDEKRFQIIARTPGTVTITVRDGKGTVETLPITVSPPKAPAAPKLEAVATSNTIYLVPSAVKRNFCIVTVKGGQGNYQLVASPAIVTITPQGKTASGSLAYAIAARARGTTTLTITDQSGQRTNITIRVL